MIFRTGSCNLTVAVIFRHGSCNLTVAGIFRNGSCNLTGKQESGSSRGQMVRAGSSMSLSEDAQQILYTLMLRRCKGALKEDLEKFADKHNLFLSDDLEDFAWKAIQQNVSSLPATPPIEIVQTPSVKPTIVWHRRTKAKPKKKGTRGR